MLFMGALDDNAAVAFIQQRRQKNCLSFNGKTAGSAAL